MTEEKRKDFPKKVKKQLLRRSGGVCEAEGPLFGLRKGKRCQTSLAYGVRFEHLNPDGCGGPPTLENGAAVCIKCHDWKTNKYDKPMVAKTTRVREKRLGLRHKRSRFPTSRDGPFKAKIGGGVERR